MIVIDMVKALDWHNFDAWTWWAEAVCGTYHVEERNGGWRVDLRFRDARHVITETDDFDLATAAAQADYTARILSALDLTAVEALQAEVARLRKVLKAAVVAMKAARQVVVAKQEHAALTGAIVLAAEAMAGVTLPALKDAITQETPDDH